ncbi:MAG: hypothetical protein JOY62_03355 [Acidobacteriaceae bacterium]|nr:hypothetical protein [Acidobacteriaceae bacterium]MBV9778988.1 hypothetical protein [Acidobacteriaceae bacterium]
MSRGLTVLFLCAGCALGQTAVTSGQKQVVVQVGDPAEFGPVGITTAIAGPMGTVPGAPYSAEVNTQRVQVLADGNRIEQTTSGSVARDSQGRVRRDEGLPGLTSSNGDAPHFVMIDDPVAQVHWTLDAQTKTAIKMPIPSGKNGAPGPFGMPPIPPPMAETKSFFYVQGGPAANPGVADQVFIKNSLSPVSPNDHDVSKTDLGAQTIEGVRANGTRITRTIPAGRIGNVQPIVITTESWYSPDLKVLMMSKSSDPRMGETVYKLTNIQRSEPAATLFHPPDDYTIKDQPGPVLVTRESKKN